MSYYMPPRRQLDSQQSQLAQQQQQQQQQQQYQSLSRTPRLSQASSSQSQRVRRRREGGPDWNEFYKNGPPREIIVIVDDDDEVPPTADNSAASQAAATTTIHAGLATTASAAAPGSTFPARTPHLQPSLHPQSVKRRNPETDGYAYMDEHRDGLTLEAAATASTVQPSPPQSHHQVPIAAQVDGTAGQPNKRRATNRARQAANQPASSASAEQYYGVAPTVSAAQLAQTQPPLSQQQLLQQQQQQALQAVQAAKAAQIAHGTATRASVKRAGTWTNAATTTSGAAATATATASAAAAAASGDTVDPTVGQRRKRQTRKSVRDEQKRIEHEAMHALQVVAGGLTEYEPPRKPIVKCGEVKVPIAPDPAPRTKVDDADGHYIVIEGTDLAGRFRIVRLLGQGTFGKVVEAIDLHDRRKERVAVKIIRSVQKYRDASKIELRVLQTLKQNDKANRNRCIHLRECFDYRGHICIVTDLLAMSVFDFLKMNGFTPFPSSHIQAFARQLFTSVAYLHDLNLIHTDLKPENILLVHEEYQTFTYQRMIPSSTTSTNRRATQRKVLCHPEIRLIDLGSATFDDEYHSSVVSTRHYRAPEIILNLGWSFPCDIWSIGCILVEFYTGDALFQTHDNLEHLAMMEAVCGYKIDARLAKLAVQKVVNGQQNGAARYFNKNRLDWPNETTSRASKKFVKAMKRLDAFITPNTPFNKQFLDLLRRIFIYDPAKRITAKEALQHPWFKEQLLDDGTEAVRVGVQRRHLRDTQEAEQRAEMEAQAAAARARNAGATVAAAAGPSSTRTAAVAL
ncbi:Dual specificity protein kinase clk3 [Ascosphaera acerosa]|nr:Dual specificity protein kinase clk3 [Ascosphaera acerosa]